MMPYDQTPNFFGGPTRMQQMPNAPQPPNFLGAPQGAPSGMLPPISQQGGLQNMQGGMIPNFLGGPNRPPQMHPALLQHLQHLQHLHSQHMRGQRPPGAQPPGMPGGVMPPNFFGGPTMQQPQAQPNFGMGLGAGLMGTGLMSDVQFPNVNFQNIPLYGG